MLILFMNVSAQKSNSRLAAKCNYKEDPKFNFENNHRKESVEVT
jgi:hypothetical protein